MILIQINHKSSEPTNGRQGIKDDAPSYEFVIIVLCFQANKIIEHRRKYERKREEKEIKEKQERVKKAREEHARAQRVSCHERKIQWMAL